MNSFKSLLDSRHKVSANPRVWGLIVCFHPDINLLFDLVCKLSEQVFTILLLNNGGLSGPLRNKLLGIKNVVVYDFQENKGIACALNEGFAQSVADGADFVVTFDQDSSPDFGHVSGLIGKWFELNSTAGIERKIGAIGPSFHDSRNGHFNYPFYRAEGLKVIKQYSTNNDSLVIADALITSGMLVPTAMWCDDLRFEELLFIDFVDTEWCFRSRERGYVHYGCFDVKMKHELSESSPVIFFGLIILKYSPLRRYYHFRNCLYLIFRSYVPYAFKFRLLAGLFFRILTLPFVDEKPRLSIKCVVMGVFDALRRRYGRRDF